MKEEELAAVKPEVILKGDDEIVFYFDCCQYCGSFEGPAWRNTGYPFYREVYVCSKCGKILEDER